MNGLTKLQIALAIMGGILAAGAILFAAYYFVGSRYLDWGDDPQRRKGLHPKGLSDRYEAPVPSGRYLIVLASN